MYRHGVSLFEAEYIEAPLNNDFSIDIEGIMNLINSKTKLLFLCSPNNPTANQFPLTKVLSLMERFPGIVVIDEAYGEFADYSAISLLDEFENLIVLKTFSKAFGLAGLRLGYAVMNPDLATTISKRLQLPYPINSVSLRMGLKMLSNSDLVKRAVEQLKAERAKLIERLNQIDGVKAFDSQTNFILFHTNTQSDTVHQRLLNKGILIKNLGRVLSFPNCLRTTVGEPWMNEKLLEALKEICGGQR
jgi:histidinol-phosphate aminotransferase